MHRQASRSFPAFFPEGTVVGEDADFFYFPAYEGKDLGKPRFWVPVRVWGITNDSPAAHVFIEYLQTTELLTKSGWRWKGFLTPHKGINTSDVFGDPDPCAR